MPYNKKRKNDGGDKNQDRSGKRSKKQYSKNGSNASANGIEVGSQGIFATCDLNKEARSVIELYALFQETSERMYGTSTTQGPVDSDDDNDDQDIEASIANEIAGIKSTKSKSEKLFTSVKLDTPCVVFFQTKEPVNPVDVVEEICRHALDTGKKQTRNTQRLTPIMRVGKANFDDLLEIGKEVLEPHFHQGQEGVKFAIRPTLRNHNVMTRDGIIKAVASLVGTKHKVDLKDYDVLILVEVLKNICGISVVKNFEQYKRFNLVQIHEATMKKEDPKQETPAPISKVDDSNTNDHEGETMIERELRLIDENAKEEQQEQAEHNATIEQLQDAGVTNVEAANNYTKANTDSNESTDIKHEANEIATDHSAGIPDAMNDTKTEGLPIAASATIEDIGDVPQHGRGDDDNSRG